MFLEAFRALAVILTLTLSPNSLGPSGSSRDPKRSSTAFYLQNGLDAQKLNAEFASLKSSDACTTGDEACVQGSFAECVGGSWVLTACPNGMSCFALPLSLSAGTRLACDTESDALNQIHDTGAQGSIIGDNPDGSSPSTSTSSSSTPSTSAWSGNRLQARFCRVVTTIEQTQTSTSYTTVTSTSVSTLTSVTTSTVTSTTPITVTSTSMVAGLLVTHTQMIPFTITTTTPVVLSSTSTFITTVTTLSTSTTTVTTQLTGTTLSTDVPNGAFSPGTLTSAPAPSSTSSTTKYGLTFSPG